MPLIKVREDESLENALKRFKRKCEKSGILTEIKKRQHYEKPSVKKKRKAAMSNAKPCLPKKKRRKLFNKNPVELPPRLRRRSPCPSACTRW